MKMFENEESNFKKMEDNIH